MPWWKGHQEKQILSQICPGDWFMSLDLKDAYFHIQVAPITDDSWDSQIGICILNYLIDCLVLAQLQAVLTSHKTLLLSYLGCLGLRVNLPRAYGHQPVSFIPGNSYGLSADDSKSLSGASNDNSAPRGLLRGRDRPSAQSFPENAGPSPVLWLGLLHMRPIQFLLKQRFHPRLGITDATA